MVRGWDFALSLTMILDILTPVFDVMVRSQNLGQNIWNSVEWLSDMMKSLYEKKRQLEAVIYTDEEDTDITPLQYLSPDEFPLTMKHFEEMKGRKFQEMELIEGWLVTSEKPGRCTWRELYLEEVVENHTELLSSLITNIEAR